MCEKRAKNYALVALERWMSSNDEAVVRLVAAYRELDDESSLKKKKKTPPVSTCDNMLKKPVIFTRN